MTDPRDDIWEDRADRAYTNLTEKPGRTLGKWFLYGLAVVVSLSILFGVIGLIGGWFSGTAQLASFGHSKVEVTAVLGDWTSLQAAAQNVCDVEKAGSKHESSDPVLIEDPALSYKAVYRRIEQDYNRRMNNLFEAYVTRHLPLPGSINHLPQTAPSLKSAEAQFC